MTSTAPRDFMPDYISPPGDTLLELLEERDWTQAAFALRTGRSKKAINEIIQGKAPISAETALQFEKVLGTPASFWIKREQFYRETLARITEEKRLKDQTPWLKKFPIKEMIRFGWIEEFRDKVAQLHALLAFLGIAYPEQWQDTWDEVAIAFRKAPSFQSDAYALSAWLRQGEREAQDITCAPFVDSKIFKQALTDIRSLTKDPPEIFQPELQRRCANAGVAVVFVPEVTGTRACGATRWLSPKKALIQLSLHYKSDDQLWFTFFHEAAHILLHSKKEIFLEGKDGATTEEREANDFAANFLIPTHDLNRFIATDAFRTKNGIQEFAQRIGIAPGIVVGRLQKDEMLPYSHCNDLKRRFAWVDGQE